MECDEPSCLRKTFSFGEIMTEETGKLILISDIIETRLRKEKELEYYQKQLAKINQKMFFLRKDLEITNLIIDMIEKEKVVDIKEQMELKLLGKEND